METSRPRFDPDEAARDALLERFLAASEDGDLQALEQLLAADAVLYADSGGKVMAPAEPLVGAPVIARFMARIPQLRRAFGPVEAHRVRVNGQPGRLLRGPGEPEFGDAERRAVQRALDVLKDGDASVEELGAIVAQARAEEGLGPPPPRPSGPARVVQEVLTVDVVDGLIQTVRIVRNPDKLAHA